MSTLASDKGPLAVPRASPVGPVLLLVAIAGACWAVTVKRMQGMDMGPGTDLGGLGWFAAVWVTMMAAMMLPSMAPMAVAGYRYNELPPAEQAALPAEAEIVDAVSAALDRIDPESGGA